jgi:hypothetical protein
MTAEQFRDDPTGTGEMLDRVDALIAEGVLNGDRVNCADLQIATRLALIEYRLDVRDDLHGRPAAELMERVLPRGG